jgi:hypothetical protein
MQPSAEIGSQLATLLDRQGEMRTNLALITQTVLGPPALPDRLRDVERRQDRAAGYYAAAVVAGGALGYLLSYLPRPH